MRPIIALSVILSLLALPMQAAERLLVQSTTSTQNSGLYDYLLPEFEAATGIDVQIVAVGTGQAIRNARNGDADVLLVHSKADEEAFVADGHGKERFDLMYNDFVLIGPSSDPAGVARTGTVVDALAAIEAGQAAFVSRGDDSGTHKKERALWADTALEPGGAWYREAGAGMGATIRMAVEMQAYTLTDRATWIAYEDKRDAVILFDGDAAMFNQYGIIILDPARHPHVNLADAEVFVGWLLSREGQDLIAAYQRNGEQLFFPNAR